MSDLSKILVTSGLTILGGMFVYVAGQVIVRFFIDPYHEYRKTVGEIADALIFYANVYMNPHVGSGDPNSQTAKFFDEAAIALRQKASLIRVRAHAIPFYNLFAKCNLVPSWDSIMIASRHLVGLSNSIHRWDVNPGETMETNVQRRTEIISALRLPPNS
jgi:hypothetical protein